MTTSADTRSHGRSRLLLAGLAVVLVGGLGLGLKTSAASSDDASAARGLEEAIRLRSGFGLDASLPHIRGVQSKYEGVRTNIGIPLTPAEQAEVDRRLALQAKLPEVSNALASIPGFSTLWIDRSRGVIVIDVVDAGSGSIARGIAERVAGEPAEPRIVQFSEAELAALHDTIVQRAPALAREGVSITRVRTDTIGNRIVIGITGLDDMTASKVRALVGDGPYDFEEATVGVDHDSRLSSGATWKAGLRITRQDGGNCTAGFNVTRGGNRYNMTAGHCNGSATAPSGTSTWWDHNWNADRFLAFNSNLNEHRADAGLVDIDEGEGSNLLFEQPDVVSRVTSRATTEYVNDYVCMSGVVNTSTCGWVNDVNYSTLRLDPAGGPIWLRNMRVASYNTSDGDSGAPIFVPGPSSGYSSGKPTVQARGINKGSEGNYAVYSFIGNALTEFSASLITSNVAVDVVSELAGKCIDISGSSTSDGAQVQIWGCNKTSAQLFYLVPKFGDYLLRNANGKCVDVDWGTAADGVRVQQWTCHEGTNQRFIIDPVSAYRFNIKPRSAWPNFCLDVYAAWTSDGTPIHQWSCHGGNNQQFYVRKF